MATLQLLEADPARGAVNVSIQPQLTLQFNADLDVSSVHASMVYLTDVTGQTILPADPALLTVTGSTLSFTPQYASGTVSLSPFTTYMVTVTPGVQDVLGHALAFPLTWSFTTGNADGALTLAPTLMDPVNATHVSSADFTPHEPSKSSP